MKYIDAEKLIAEINARIERCEKDEEDGYPDTTSPEAILKSVRTNIESLQQEQPEGLHFTPLNWLIQKIPSKNWNDTVNNYAKKLRDCLIKEGYLKDAEILQGYISYMNGNNVPMATIDEQEQLKVDLEKEIDKEWENCGPIDEGMGYESALLIVEQFHQIARHFYELGLNARKP